MCTFTCAGLAQEKHCPTLVDNGRGMDGRNAFGQREKREGHPHGKTQKRQIVERGGLETIRARMAHEENLPAALVH